MSRHRSMPILGGLLILLAVAAPARADETASWQIAEAARKQGDEALRRRDYQAAARAFETAQHAFEKVDRGDRKQRAAQLAAYCLKKQVYAHNQRLLRELAAAEAAMKNGDLADAAETMRQLAVEFRELSEQFQDESLARNAVHCLGQSGLLPIKIADAARKQGRWADAVAAYEEAIRSYEKAHEMLGTDRFANNLRYARTFLQRARFEHNLASHAQLPDLKFEPMVGEPVSLGKLRGRKTLLVFWAHWCGNCREHLPALEKFWQSHRTDGIAVIGVCLDRSEGWARGRASQAAQLVKESLTFPNVWATPQVIELFGDPGAVPTALWIDESARIVERADLENLTTSWPARETTSGRPDGGASQAGAD